MTSYHIISEFLGAIFPFMHWTNLRLVAWWVSQVATEEWSLAQKLLETFPHLEAWAALQVFFSWKFPIWIFVEAETQQP